MLQNLEMQGEDFVCDLLYIIVIGQSGVQFSL